MWINVTLEPTDYAHVDNPPRKGPGDLSTNPQDLLLLLLYLIINIYIIRSHYHMKISINRQYFIEQLNHCLKAISPRTTLPILNGIKLEVKDNHLILTGSDAEISRAITRTAEMI